MTERSHRGRTGPPTRVAALCVAGLLAAACGSGSKQAGTTAWTTAGTTPGTTTGTTAPSSNQAPQEFGLSAGELDARIESTEQLIASCMREQGFAYVALDAATVKEAMATDKSAPGLSSEEYVAKFGLGITTQFEKPLIVFGAGPENNAYLAGLAPADQVAFRRSLWGESPEMNHARAIEEEDFATTGGCTHQAAEQTYSADELSGSYVNPADRRVAQDPRMTKALAEWSACMRAGGFDYATPDDVDADLGERLDAITNGRDPAGLSGSALDELHGLQDEERAVAATLTECDERIVEPVRAEIETELYGSSS